MKRKSFGRRGLFLAGLVVAVIIFIFVVSEFNLADRFGKTEQTKNFSNENSSKIDKETGNSADRATQASSEKPVEQGEANAASTNQTSTVKPGETSETAGNTSEETGKQIAGNSSETHPAGTEPGKEEDTGPVVQPEQAIAISGTQTGGNSETAVAPTAVKHLRKGRFTTSGNLNQKARQTVFPATQRKKRGLPWLLMTACRTSTESALVTLMTKISVKSSICLRKAWAFGSLDHRGLRLPNCEFSCSKNVNNNG